MKKIIAISVMFALIAGAVFADTSLGGSLNVNFDLVASKTGEGAGADYVGIGSYGGGGDFNASWEGENAGGQFRIRGDNFPGHAIGWWKPIDQLKIHLGGWDGEWGYGTIFGWGFTAGAKDFVATKWGGYGTSFAGDSPRGNWGGLGNGVPALGFSIYPADGFEINIGIPFVTINKDSAGYFDVPGEWDGTSAFPPTPAAGDKKYKQVIAPLAIVLQNTKLNVKADIPDVGTVKVALDLHKEGRPADQIGVDGTKDGELFTDFYLNFYLSAIENMGIELGAGLTSSSATKKNDLIDLSLGYKVDAGDFNVKAAFSFGIAGYKSGTKNLIPFTAQILPSYNLGSLTAFVNVGMGTTIGASTSVVELWLNPYIQLPISGGNFWAGFKFYNSGVSGDKAQWSIPVGFTFGF